MPECECLKGCPFFNNKMEKMPIFASIYKKHFCLGDKTKCARYTVMKRLGKEKVPIDLSPDDIVRARNIILEESLKYVKKKRNNNKVIISKVPCTDIIFFN